MWLIILEVKARTYLSGTAKTTPGDGYPETKIVRFSRGELGELRIMKACRWRWLFLILECPTRSAGESRNLPKGRHCQCPIFLCSSTLRQCRHLCRHYPISLQLGLYSGQNIQRGGYFSFILKCPHQRKWTTVQAWTR